MNKTLKGPVFFLLICKVDTDTRKDNQKMRKQQTEVVWGGVRTSLSHHAPPPPKEGAMIAPWGSSRKRLETKGGLLTLLTLPFSMGSFKRQGKAAGSTPGLPASRNALSLGS